MYSVGNSANGGMQKRGMILPFQPLALTFDSISYYVDMPAVSLQGCFSITQINPCNSRTTGVSMYMYINMDASDFAVGNESTRS